jgi:hypothetical protein
MAKKTAKKKAPAKKSKPASKKPAPKKAASVDPMAPRSISTGKGPGPREVGARLVELFNAGKGHQAEKELWADQIVSIEGMGQSWHGRKAVVGKNEWWMSQNELLGGSAEGPYVGATGFAVKFVIDVREKATGKQTRMTEIGFYTVLNGKIIQEEFCYGA